MLEVRQRDEGDTKTFPEATTPFQTFLDNFDRVAVIAVVLNWY
jgi:hypothetical protein